MIPQKQLSLADIFEDCKDIFESDKPQFLTLLENHIDLDEIIPFSFYNHYYAATGRNRKYPLTAMLWTLIIQHLFSIPTDSLLLVFLHYSRLLRESVALPKFLMPPKSLVLSRIFYWTYNLFLISLLISLNRYAKILITTLPLCFCLTLPVSKLM